MLANCIRVYLTKLYHGVSASNQCKDGYLYMVHCTTFMPGRGLPQSIQRVRAMQRKQEIGSNEGRTDLGVATLIACNSMYS